MYGYAKDAAAKQWDVCGEKFRSRSIDGASVDWDTARGAHPRRFLRRSVNSYCWSRLAAWRIGCFEDDFERYS